MGDNRSYAALEWVVGEIGESLKQARQALEAYVANTEDTTRIRFCLTHIHQVHGSLQMVEFYGAALLAEEMEGLAQALMNKSVKNEPEAQEVLMRAILQLPIYLDQVKHARKDHPSSVLPLLNDLRAARGEALLTETKLFSPNMAPAHQIAKAPAAVTDNKQFIGIVTKLRQMYQYAAAGVIRNVNRDENIAYLSKVFARLRKLTHGTARQPLWDISLALLEGLQNESIDSSVTVKNLLRQLDKEIKDLMERGIVGLDIFTNDELIKNLLYYVARANADGKHIQRIKKLYQLEDALPDAEKKSDGDEVMAPDLEAIRSVVSALKDELDAIKHALDISLTDREQADINEALPIIKRVADTMAVLGIGDLRKQILSQGQALQEAAQRGNVPNDLLMGVAGKIIEIENALDMMASGAGHERGDNLGINALDQAQESVLRESRNGLEQAKDAIIEYIASQWNRDHLANVPSHLREIGGGLDMVPLRKPAAILRSCADYIQQQLLEKQLTPEWTTLDTLADAIASVEYYLERLAGDREEEDEMLLGVAEDSVRTLGYPINMSQAASAAKPAPAKDTSAAQAPKTSAPTEIADDDAVAATIRAESNPVESNVVPFAHDESENDGNEPVETAPLAATAATTSTNTAHTTAADDDDGDLIDDEIVEIFIEEAGEVIGTINEFFPRWAEDFSDQEALTEFRRAFHTLKGSGRMVNANHVGELAWAVENMLNRVIDGTVEPNEGHVALIEKVRPLLPVLVQAFKERAPHPAPAAVAQLEKWAESLSKGEMPAALFENGEFGNEELGSGELGGEAFNDASFAGEVSGIEEVRADASSDDMPVPIPGITVEEVDDEETDSVLWEIFASEALTHLEVVADYIRAMDESAPLFTPPSDPMQRALHTLKGSAHMADVKPIAELATPLERFVKELRIYQVDINADILQLLKDGVVYIEQVLQQIENGEELEIPRLPQFIARVAELRENTVVPLIRQEEAKEQSSNKIDPELLSIFMAEEMKLLLDADQLINQWRTEGIQASQLEPLVEELQTLARGSERANLPSMALLSTQLYKVYEAYESRRLKPDETFFDTLYDGHAELLDMVDAVAVGQNVAPISEQIAERLAMLLETSDVVGSIPSLGGAADIDFNKTDFSTGASNKQQAIAEEQIADSTMEEEAADIDEVAMEIEAVDIDMPDVEIVEPADVPDFQDSFDAIELEAQDFSSQDFESQEQPELETSERDADETLTFENVTFEDVSVDDAAETETESELKDVAAAGAAADTEEVDLEIFEIFIEEAEELLEEIDESIHDWEQEWEEKSHAEALKRALHTLKGGARLAGLMGLGELAHEFETLIISRGESGDIDEAFFALVHGFQDKLITGTDKVKSRVAGHIPAGLEEVMAASEDFDTAALDVAERELLVETVDELPAPSAQQDVSDELDIDEADEGEEDSAPAGKSSRGGADILPFAPKPRPPAKSDITLPAGREMGTTSGGGIATSSASQAAARRSGPQEVIKVSAELLEELVNLAGETSISRGRLEEQNSELVFAIDEMEATVHRLQEQLRRLDIETEAQMIFRQEQMQEAEDFDPLEMDRYSQLQQLSRSLMESASDLMDLTHTLTDKTRDTETLLLQQSRINTDLQEGLMRSRMVPFSRMVPRLRRIVRQIATEVGKRVSFELDNVEGEMDRSVLERMVAPLEHMLRNAVDHGIESIDERIKKGKPETGRIVLSLGREGGDVLLRLVDDGRGIDLDKVRAKAVERGLMAAGAKLSDHDVMQFILHAGFSTADKVTQISGRGVGMDVVHAEIKQLGGAMFINSRWGEGTEFIIRLPFTVSVNRALMIQIAEHNYAIPLNTIEGIVRVSPFELEHYYQDENARFEYAGENYLVRYLGAMLNEENLPRLEGQSMPMPVVLVRTAEHAVALQVDKLLGSREIVVKSLGPQFSAVEGLSGATVMGDGSVVVILDPHAMIRKEMALSASSIQALEASSSQENARVQTVLVVDDSVTVRKVTSRFLEREGYEVLTAKDGADALQVLQDHIPDVMLLDIEMPRMDGFEVAKNIRGTSRLKDIPIIMITSRTGDKHRERALSLGVDKYMGKPYQEEALLNNIRELIGTHAE